LTGLTPLGAAKVEALEEAIRIAMSLFHHDVEATDPRRHLAYSNGTIKRIVYDLEQVISRVRAGAA
jgi:hypothetical protein